MRKVTMTIGELFEFNEFIENVKDDTFKKPKYDVYIESPNGIVPIRYLVKKMPEDWIEVKLENDAYAKVSLHHKFSINEKVIFAKDLKEGDYLETKEGLKKIISIKRIKNKNEYLYGLSLDAPHLYYDANGILHHNTAFMINTTANLLLRKKNVIYFTLEITEFEIAKRIDSNLLAIPTWELSKLSQDEYINKMKQLDLGKLVIKEYPAGTLNTLKIKNVLKKLKAKEGFEPDVIVIDYLGIMASSRLSLSSSGGLYQYYKLISEELHGLAKELKVPILTASQLNRSSFNNLDAGMELISDSIGIVQTADTIIAILSSEKMRQEKKVLLKFLKNRATGRLNSHVVEFQPEIMTFRDIEEDNDFVNNGNQSNQIPSISQVQQVQNSFIQNSVVSDDIDLSGIDLG